MKPNRIVIHQSAYDHIFNINVFFGTDVLAYRCVPEEITRRKRQVWGVYHTNGENRNERAATFHEPLPGEDGDDIDLAYSSGILAVTELAMTTMRKRAASDERPA